MAIKSRDEWRFNDFGDYKLNKSKLITNYVNLMIDRCRKIFKYKNLPDTIKERELVEILQNNGYAIITEVNGKLYAFRGGLGGIPDEYYEPTIAIVNNPYLNFNKTLKINEECIIMRNDSVMNGLLNIHLKYAKLLAEIDISFYKSIINTRKFSLIVADNEKAYQSALKYSEDVLESEDNSIILGSPLFENIKKFDYTTESNIKDLIELRQYLLSNWYIELGLNSNFNMKRETLTDEELGVNSFTLKPFIDDMYDTQKEAIEAINEKYNLNIEIEKNSSWALIDKMDKLNQDNQDKKPLEPTDNQEKEVTSDDEI